MSAMPAGVSDTERHLADILHDLRTPLNQIIGLSEMLLEIAEEQGHYDLTVGFGTMREGGVDLNILLQDRALMSFDPGSAEDFWPLRDACRAGISRVLGFAELVLAEPVTERLAEYRGDLQSIRQAAYNFIEGARNSGLLIRLQTAKHWDTSAPVGRTGVGPSLTGGRMLIVDDESLNREVLRRRLQREGCCPTGVSSGPEALDLLAREDFDVVLLDMQMPGMNGMQVLQAIKEDEKQRHLPVIMLSALTDIDRVARCIELGAEDYLPKPINAVLLRARLGACLDKKRFRDREQEHAEELLRSSKLQSIGALAGGLAHDFNNMLTAVLGNLSLLQHLGSLPAEAVPKICEAQRGAVRAQELTRHLLTFAEGGAPIKETIALGPLLRDATAFVLRGSTVQCHFEIADNLWDLQADPSQLAQVVSNVVLNAIEATPAGGEILLRAANSTTAPHLPEGEYVSISIEDFGVGIAAEHLDRIFDPFFTTKKQARGLGLAAAYSIVQRHGGHIAVESARGAGSAVTITLPACPAVARSEHRAPTQPCAPAPGEPRKLRVLVMDDEEAIRLLIEATLRTLDHEVVCTCDGEAFLVEHAVAKASGRSFDLAVLDLTIPGGMGGKEAIRRLRERDEDVRAIVSSGYSTDPVMAHYHEHGFDAVLPKPYLVSDLIRVVQQVSAPRSVA